MQPTGPTGPSAEPTKRLVCRDCDWTTERTDGEIRENADRVAIEHYVATGHPIEASDESRRSGSGGSMGGAASVARGRSDD